jgi:glycosyltransferase involved in cell wall biosynthesis
MIKKSTNMQSIVSVLLPTYNAGKYLRPALESILQQTYSNLEIIVINDGSTDGSLSTIDHTTDSRITIIHQKNSGKSAALNKALGLMIGEYWLVQDADDLSYSNRVEELLKVLKANENLAAVYSGHDLLIKNTLFAPTTSPKTVAQCNVLINSLRMPAHDATGMYRTAFVSKLRWDPELKIGEGLDFILRVGERFPLCCLNQCLYTYRINENSLIRKTPCNNITGVNQAIKKACIRRDLDYNIHRLQATTRSGKRAMSELNHIVSHCMESVVDLKVSGHWIKAIGTGITCFKIAPDNYSFYKPLVYSLLPVFIIKKYRKIKRQGAK